MQESIIVKQLKEMTVEEAKLFGCDRCGEGFEIKEETARAEIFEGLNADSLPDRRIVKVCFICPHCGGNGGVIYEDSEMRAAKERLDKLQGRKTEGEEAEKPYTSAPY